MRRFLALGVLALAACGEAEPTGPWVGLTAAIGSAPTGDAWTLMGDHRNDDYTTYPEKSTIAPLDLKSLQSLKAILSDPKSFSDVPKPCHPVPGVKVRLNRTAAAPIWIYICLDCAEIFIYEGRKFREHKEIDPSVDAVTALIKKVFPGDFGIQKLK